MNPAAGSTAGTPSIPDASGRYSMTTEAQTSFIHRSTGRAAPAHHPASTISRATTFNPVGSYYVPAYSQSYAYPQAQMSAAASFVTAARPAQIHWRDLSQYMNTMAAPLPNYAIPVYNCNNNLNTWVLGYGLSGLTGSFHSTTRPNPRMGEPLQFASYGLGTVPPSSNSSTYRGENSNGAQHAFASPPGLQHGSHFHSTVRHPFFDQTTINPSAYMPPPAMQQQVQPDSARFETFQQRVRAANPRTWINSESNALLPTLYQRGIENDTMQGYASFATSARFPDGVANVALIDRNARHSPVNYASVYHKFEAQPRVPRQRATYIRDELADWDCLTQNLENHRRGSVSLVNIDWHGPTSATNSSDLFANTNNVRAHRSAIRTPQRTVDPSISARNMSSGWQTNANRSSQPMGAAEFPQEPIWLNSPASELPFMPIGDHRQRDGSFPPRKLRNMTSYFLFVLTLTVDDSTAEVLCGAFGGADGNTRGPPNTPEYPMDARMHPFDQDELFYNAYVHDPLDLPPQTDWTFTDRYLADQYS